MRNHIKFFQGKFFNALKNEGPGFAKVVYKMDHRSKVTAEGRREKCLVKAVILRRRSRSFAVFRINSGSRVTAIDGRKSLLKNPVFP
jgi:hypothetical protein